MLLPKVTTDARITSYLENLFGSNRTVSHRVHQSDGTNIRYIHALTCSDCRNVYVCTTSRNRQASTCCSSEANCHEDMWCLKGI